MQYVFERDALPQRALAGPLDHGAVGHRIAERHPEFNDVRARTNGRERHLARGGEIRIAARKVRHQSGPMLEVQRHVRCPNHPMARSSDFAMSFSFSVKIPMSLSPRPEMLTTTTSFFFIRGARLMHSATACADSSAGMIPSIRASKLQASRASSSVADTYSARPVSRSQACSGPTPG